MASTHIQMEPTYQISELYTEGSGVLPANRQTDGQKSTN